MILSTNTMKFFAALATLCFALVTYNAAAAQKITTAPPPQVELKLKYFDLSEFYKGRVLDKMDHEFLLKIDDLRGRVGFALIINSEYRSPTHPNEIMKKKPGTHAQGIAVDIAAWDPIKKSQIIKHAKALGFTGIGIYPGHVHLDMRKGKKVSWVYERYTKWQKT